MASRLNEISSRFRSIDSYLKATKGWKEFAENELKAIRAREDKKICDDTKFSPPPKEDSIDRETFPDFSQQQQQKDKEKNRSNNIYLAMHRQFAERDLAEPLKPSDARKRGFI